MATTNSPTSATASTAAEPTRRELILRAAERLFAIDGYHGTTMRDIAREAGVKLSLLVYHFETKENLYYSIFERRQYVNEERLRRLQQIEDLSAPESLGQIIDAWIDPVLQMHANPDDIWYARLVLREASDPSSQERNVLSTLFDPMARAFIDALKQALPGRPEGFHHWAYMFSVGVLTQSAFDSRVENLVAETNPQQKPAILRSYLIAALTYG
ncbi:TetR/AcrR family transcriptional regulator [Actinomadura geliboluensis]|uniref:TetR/AcrR family transcriptional regulator n=1 Tax=Actinomadura geliboluensis TaxID=882440 RepID=A0A5S4G7F7_9ACTN|nr:TetR/AcrR family transcriptional regulator [Actinomadura geliboluensis]TMR28956.1 TetR/AcrR family transcriptional regulator [Actinomadura geliboluensis]